MNEGKLGKLPAEKDARTLLVKNYFGEPAHALPKPKASAAWTAACKDPKMFGNDEWGDCVFAAVAHAIQTLSAVLGLEVTISTKTVVDEYLAYTHGVDDGAVLLEVLKILCSRGLFGRKPALGFAAFDPSDHRLLAQCVDVFGGVIYGFGLPLSAQGKTVWDVVDGPTGVPWSWGGHAVYGGHHALQSVVVDSWAARIPATLPFVDKHSDEGFVIILEEFLDSERRSASGVLVDNLIADLALVRAA